MSALDRCDKCGAQALVRATLANGELYFCGHHGREMSSKLVSSALVVFDPEGVFNYGR
jgi:endonuclease YncB( thermonuclease family)